jgi:dipeptidyl aminopeptidase/acylaminoacyl peptidase
LGDRWFIAAAAWSPSGERIVIAGDHDSPLTLPMAYLWVVNRDGSAPQCRTAGLVGNLGLRVHHDMPTWETSQNSIFTVPEVTHAYATVLKHGSAEICRIDLDGPIRCEAIVSGPRSCVILDASEKTSQLLYGASDLHTPWELFLLDISDGQEKRLTHLNDAVLAQWPTLEVEHLKFESADGVLLEGWYLARADRQGPQPTVLFIHGGPMLATGYAFRFDFHLLAANGYAVLFANFRGSSGYGEPFMRGILGDWGARGFPDHMAAADVAIARGLADSDRLGVWGASHGGFATCWIVGHTRRFRAAVAESAITNFATHYYLCDAPDIFALDLGGRPHEIPDVYRSRSPLTYAWRCKTPTLMLHGEEDLRCPVSEAEQFYRALHDVGCPTELVRIPGMTHMGDSIGPLSVRRAQNEALLDWFERHL